MTALEAFVAAAPYLQAAAAGTYLAAAVTILIGRWRQPAIDHPWFLLAMVVAFVAGRAMPEWATFTAPVTFVVAIAFGAQIVRAPGGMRPGLWRALALVPVAVVMLIVAASRFSIADGDAIKVAESVLLAIPAPCALIAMLMRPATSPVLRT